MGGDAFGLVGQTVDGQYRVERPIGEGGFSVVYRATHVGLGEPIALKCLKLAAANDTEAIESFMRRFRDEGRLQYRLAQDNLDIVRCMTSGTVVSQGTGALVPYLVLEWLDGRSLALDLRERRAKGMRGRPIDEVLGIFAPVAGALDHAHRLGVVHRDVKPGNLFLATRGGATRTKVLDFGLAKIVDETIGITLAATMGQIMMCSPRYAAPEQFDPKVGAIGPWTDVYSLALVMLETLRDEKVRRGDGIVACMSEALDARNALSASALGIKLPSRVELALARATALDIRTRQQSAGDLWREITEAMARRTAAISTRNVQAAAALGVAGLPDAAGGVPASLAATTFDPSPWHGSAQGQGQQGQQGQPPASAVPPSSGLGGTVVMQDAPMRTRSNPSMAATPAPPAAGAPAHYAPPAQHAPYAAPAPRAGPPVLNLGPALAPAPPGAAVAPVYAQQQLYRPMAPPPPPASQPIPPVSVPLSQRSPSRAPIVVLVLLLVLGVLGVAAFFAWREWKLRGGFHLSQVAASSDAPPPA